MVYNIKINGWTNSYGILHSYAGTGGNYHPIMFRKQSGT